MSEPVPGHEGEALDWLHELGKRRAGMVPAFDVEETLLKLRAMSHHQSDPNHRAVCPVCGLPAGAGNACAECGWTLRSALRLGQVTEETQADFGRRLDAARRQFDTQAAVLVSSDLGRMAPWIRGGRPDPGEWAVAQATADDTAVAAMDEAAAITVLATTLRPDARVMIVEIGPEGVAVTRASVDRAGAPLLSHDQVMTWPELIPMLAADEDERRFQLAGGIAGLDRRLLEGCLENIARLVPPQVPEDEEALVLSQPAGWRLLEDAARRVLAGLGSARLLRIAGLPVSGNGLLATLADRIPLLHGYGIVVAAITPGTGAVTLETRPLFRPGDVRGAESVVTLRRPPGEQGTTTLAVAIDHARPTVTAASTVDPDVLSLHSMPLPDQPVYELRAVLDGPGRVRFTAPREASQLSRPWQDVLAALPGRIDVTDGPVDLICALELSGPQSVVDRRRGLVRDLLRYLSEEYPGDGDRLRVGLLGCTDHVFAPGEEHKKVVRAKALGPLPQAQAALARFEGTDIRYPPAAPVEDLIQIADQMQAQARTPGRAARLLLVAGRRGHPRQLGADLVLPCPLRCDWRAASRNLAGAGVPVLAVVDAMPGPAARAEFWGQVAPAGVRALDDARPTDIAASLALTVPLGQHIGIPLAG